jgi:hypothetical protein
MNRENISKLIEHYNQVETLPDWTFDHCIAMVMRNKGMVSCMFDLKMIAEALDIDLLSANTLVYCMSGSFIFCRDDPNRHSHNKAVVVDTLERLLTTGVVKIGVTTVAEIVDRQNGEN